MEPLKEMPLKAQLFYKNEEQRFAWIVTDSMVYEVDNSNNFTKTIIELPADDLVCTAAAVSPADNVGLLACYDSEKRSAIHVISIASTNPIIIGQIDLADQ